MVTRDFVGPEPGDGYQGASPTLGHGRAWVPRGPRDLGKAGGCLGHGELAVWWGRGVRWGACLGLRVAAHTRP